MGGVCCRWETELQLLEDKGVSSAESYKQRMNRVLWAIHSAAGALASLNILTVQVFLLCRQVRKGLVQSNIETEKELNLREAAQKDEILS